MTYNKKSDHVAKVPAWDFAAASFGDVFEQLEFAIFDAAHTDGSVDFPPLDNLSYEARSATKVVAAQTEKGCGATPTSKEHNDATRQSMCSSASSAIQTREAKVFDYVQMFAAASLLPTMTADSEAKNRLKNTFEKLIASGENRPLTLPGPAWQAQIEELQSAFPAFARAIEEVVKPSMAILAAGGLARPVPLLLVGSPGAGKSYFASMLAQMLQVPVVKMDMSSVSMSCLLNGLGPHWASSGPGEVFRTLAFGRAGRLATANPVFVLDEVDKIGGDSKHDPIGPLHALLEESSAKHFEDESLPGIGIDTSHIRWILTANAVSPISTPILSRVHVVHVTEMTEIENLHVRARIFAGVVTSLGLPEFEENISPTMLKASLVMGPREFKTRSTMAVGKALVRGAWKVIEHDFDVSAPIHKPKMGF